MIITVTEEQGSVPVTVLHLEGDLAGESSDLLTARARQAIDGGAQYLLLDLSGIAYMGSTGIRAVNEIFGWLRSLPDGEDEAALRSSLVDGKYKSRRLKILNPCRQARKALATAGIDSFIEIHDDLPEAVASFWT